MSRTGDGLVSNDDSLIFKFVSYSVIASSLVLSLHVSPLSLVSELPSQSKQSRTFIFKTQVRSSRCRLCRWTLYAVRAKVSVIEAFRDPC